MSFDQWASDLADALNKNNNNSVSTSLLSAPKELVMDVNWGLAFTNPSTTSYRHNHDVDLTDTLMEDKGDVWSFEFDNPHLQYIQQSIYNVIALSDIIIEDAHITVFDYEGNIIYAEAVDAGTLQLLNSTATLSMVIRKGS